jgi:C1A family cysteine protease
MKNKIFSLILIALLFQNCGVDEPVDPAFFNEKDIVVDYSQGPKTNGLLESGSCGGAVALPFDFKTLPLIYPSQFDLSNLMPPVLSQGSIGSCTAWATTYYLKSYQEKIQHNSTYSDLTIMSPSYTYNQIKISNDCSKGSAIVCALELLRTKGAISISDFPYSQTTCSTIPNQNQNNLAQANKISSYDRIELNNLATEEEAIIKCKKLIFSGKPLIIGMSLDRKFANAVPKNSNNIFICNDYNPSFHYGDHAMLITGYDDSLNAFKVVNSWGEYWGNSGYCWINYDFFKQHSSSSYKTGISEIWFTTDL